MQQHLLRHFEAHAAQSYSFTDLWLRVICCLTLIIPVWSSLTFGSKTKETSDQYILATTPPDKFFKIWIVIYMLEVFIMVYALFSDCWSETIWLEFTIINISCGIWAFTFNSGKLWGVDISILCQIVNLLMGQYIWVDLAKPWQNSLVGTAMGMVIRNIVSFFIGWFIAAAALGLFIIFVYNCGMSLKVQLILFWIVTPIVYAAFLVYNIEVIGSFADTIGLFLSMVWAVCGAAMATSKSKQYSNLV